MMAYMCKEVEIYRCGFLVKFAPDFHSIVADLGPVMLQHVVAAGVPTEGSRINWHKKAPLRK